VARGPTTRTGEATGADKAYLDAAIGRLGAVVGGRNTYKAAEHWGGRNPWEVPFFVVTHRTHEEPAGAGFTFVDGVDEAIDRAREAAGDKDVSLMGGADVIRQALRANQVDELFIEIARRAGRREASLRGFRQQHWARAPGRHAVAVRHAHPVPRRALR
jgi:dihydrofolate reductase